ncbi:hypothetical protein COS86_03690 [Candidatus Bathyarchaeota archaeon CG07_land_8_20_14_0_80_47_9]|nr:MAG: hypothetical protein COS86_03690 [Candidatus Bathyarchaeota archaeon CG07_land_8_20_14_0_80_47_9]
MVNMKKQRGPTVVQLPERTDCAAYFAATVFTRPEKARRGKEKLQARSCSGSVGVPYSQKRNKKQSILPKTRSKKNHT